MPDQSWSLIILGAADFIKNNEGLLQEGFLLGTNFLYTVEVDGKLIESVMKFENNNTQKNLYDLISSLKQHKNLIKDAIKREKDIVPVVDNNVQEEKEISNSLKLSSKQVGKQTRKERQKNKIQSDTAQSEKTPQILPDTSEIIKPNSIKIGIEFECVTGHRFFISTEILSKITGIKIPNPAVILNSDIPIFMACTCTSQAQLQRIYIVTLTKPRLITIKPQVLICSTNANQITHLFDTGIDILLPPNSTICLRLPYVYHSNEGIISINSPGYAAFLIKGIIQHSKEKMETT